MTNRNDNFDMNDEGGSVPAFIPEILSPDSAIAQIRGEIDSQIATARAYPRKISEFQERVISLATLDRETAEECMYAIPRGGKVITGPSVRFAEIVASSYGNIRVAAKVTGLDDKYVTVQATAIDLERNYAAGVEVRRRITDRNNRKYTDDMITVTANAACSIAFRNALFKVVPKALIKAVTDKIQKVALGDERTLSVSRAGALAYFSGHGIDKSRVFALLGRAGEADMTTEDIIILRGLRTAIEEGSTTIEEAFPQEEKDKAVNGKISLKKPKPPETTPTNPAA